MDIFNTTNKNKNTLMYLPTTSINDKSINNFKFLTR